MIRLIRGHCFVGFGCLLLATVLFGCTILEASAEVPGAATQAQTGSEQKPTLKERILEIPPGTRIEGRLLNKQKLRGRLGEVTDEGFNFTTAKGDKTATQRIAFQELKSFKKTGDGKAGRAVMYTLAGIGAVIATLTVIAFAKWGN